MPSRIDLTSHAESACPKMNDVDKVSHNLTMHPLSLSVPCTKETTHKRMLSASSHALNIAALPDDETPKLRRQVRQTILDAAGYSPSQTKTTASSAFFFNFITG